MSRDSPTRFTGRLLFWRKWFIASSASAPDENPAFTGWGSRNEQTG